MFNLEEAISEWRQQMAVGGIKSPEVLDELESHLREDVRTILATGTPEAQAFRLAVLRLGCVDSLSTEFKRIADTPSMPLKVGALLWTGMSTALAMALLMGVFQRKLSFLLVAHIFCLTAGYGAAFLAGGFGIYYVCCRWFRGLSSAHAQALSRAAFSFAQLSMGLVLAGLLLGIFWSGTNRGVYFQGGPRELGTLCASVWLIAFCLIQRFGQLSPRVTMLLCIIGNVVVSLAWFGAGAVAHGNGMATYWPLDALLGIHVFFLTLDALPRFETAQA